MPTIVISPDILNNNTRKPYDYLPPSPPKSRTPSPFQAGQQTARYRGSVATAANAGQQQHSYLSASGMHSSDSAAGSSTGTGVVQRKHSLPNGNGYVNGAGPVGSSAATRPNGISNNNHGVPASGYGPPSASAQYATYPSSSDAHPYPNGIAGGVGNSEYGSHSGYTNGYTPSTGTAYEDPSSATTLPFQQIYSKATEAVKGVAANVTSSSSKTLPSYLSAASARDSPSSGTRNLPPLNGSSNLPSLKGTAAGGPTGHLHQRRKSVAQALTPSISSVRFISYCGLWYASSALSSNTGKSILNRFRYPVTLTFIQFGFVAGWCIIFLVGREQIARYKKESSARGGHLARQSYAVSSNGWGIQKPSRKGLEGTVIMSVFQVAGHIFSSMAIARVPVSTVHTIKALSPLFTVLSYGILFRVRYSTKTYLSLLPLTLGVMLACSFDLRANAVGFLCALGSTLVFVSQNIFSKKLLPKEGGSSHHHHGAAGDGEKKLDKLHLLLYSSGIAFILMIPIWMYYDSGTVLFGTESVSTTSFTALFFYFTLNGSVHFAQNLLAFSILSLTSPVTYSIASLVKRIAVICMALIWFRQTVYPIQGLGITMTFAGLWLYNQAKESVAKGEKVRVRVERRGSILLPSSKEDLSDDSRSSTPIPNGRAEGSKVGWAIVR